jgi:hypothetical protein
MSTAAVAAIREGRATFEWTEIESRHGGKVAVFRVLADALKVAGVREAFTPRTAQEAADLLDGLLPTPKLLDLRYRAAGVLASPRPKFYPQGIGMATRQAIVDHSKRVDAAVDGHVGTIQNVGKHWVLHPLVTPQRAVLYGWHVPSHQHFRWQGVKVFPSDSVQGQFVIQAPSNWHDHGHIDYSMTLLLVHGDCTVDGEAMRTADVLRSPELFRLAASGNAPLQHLRLPGVAAPGGGAPVVNQRPLLKRGARGDAVRQLQALLVRAGLDLSPFGADGDFGATTERAVRAYQATRGLTIDGVVGRGTWTALEAERAPSVAPDPGAGLPPLPSFPPIDDAGRKAAFGAFTFVSAPTASNPEAIRITDDWVARNIVVAEIPQLAQVPGRMFQGRRIEVGPAAGRVQCHRLAAEPLRRLWLAWEEAGLLARVLTWGGLWVPRFKRGSRSDLSNHAYGTAFDINVSWNFQGADPAPRGRQGSVMELVPLAHECGFFWGGHFAGSSRDGMHFELARV